MFTSYIYVWLYIHHIDSQNKCIPTIHHKTDRRTEIFSVVIDSMPQMMSIELKLYLTQNIPLIWCIHYVNSVLQQTQEEHPPSI